MHRSSHLISDRQRPLEVELEIRILAIYCKSRSGEKDNMAEDNNDDTMAGDDDNDGDSCSSSASSRLSDDRPLPRDSIELVDKQTSDKGSYS